MKDAYISIKIMAVDGSIKEFKVFANGSTEGFRELMETGDLLVVDNRILPLINQYKGDQILQDEKIKELEKN
ncbi:MAG: hypothetical protein COB15_09600 [Flavobacteriales bacterium]|jgi:hypothetical protein|nr:MAG: hypothetical protein COB15_09600 [Flavobacteriales bacterium]